MSTNKERLLVPEDFIQSLPVESLTDQTNILCRPTSVSQRECLPTYGQILGDLKKENDSKYNPILNCLNPGTFSIYNCFKSSSNIVSIKDSSKGKLLSNGIISKGNSNSLLLKSSNIYSLNGGKSSGRSLLTPDNFLTVKEPEGRTVLSNIPQVFLEAHKSSNNKNIVQTNCCIYNVFAPQCDRSEARISGQDNAAAIDKIHLKDENICEKPILTPNCFLKTSVRRKLHFDTPLPSTVRIKEINSSPISKGQEVTMKLEDCTTFTSSNTKLNNSLVKANFPKFSCSLDISDSIYKDSSLCNASKNSSSSQRKLFPPIGVFWDIENCQVPKGLSATHIVQAIRKRFFDGFYEAEFVCVCDSVKENAKVLEELNDAQVNVIHVGSTMKNAADDKLLQSMRRFADIHGAGATIVLISGDSDFATELYDLRYRKKLNVILVHNAYAPESLKLSAHETIFFTDVTNELPRKPLQKPPVRPKNPKTPHHYFYRRNKF